MITSIGCSIVSAVVPGKGSAAEQKSPGKLHATDTQTENAASRRIAMMRTPGMIYGQVAPAILTLTATRM
jgi:hypothetical protein